MRSLSMLLTFSLWLLPAEANSQLKGDGWFTDQTIGSPAHLLAGGYVLGGLNLAGGLGLILATDLRWYEGLQIGLGIAHMTIGIFDIGVTIWAHTIEGQRDVGIRDPDTPGLRLTPLLLTDTSGHPALGLGLGLVGW